MLRWIRGVRLDFKTGIAIIVLALVVWGLMTWARIVDFVPDELEQPAADTTEAPVPVRVP